MCVDCGECRCVCTVVSVVCVCTVVSVGVCRCVWTVVSVGVCGLW